MTMANRPNLTTIALHWLVAVSIIVLLCMGLLMAKFEIWAWYEWHKAIGVVAFLVILFRLLWRRVKKWPEHAGPRPLMEKTLSAVVQWVLIVGSVAMPLTGILFSGGGGHGVSLFGWKFIPPNVSPTDPTEAVPYDLRLEALGQTLHELIGYLMVIALLLHVVGALKHHFWDRDDTLRRMLGQPSRGMSDDQ